MKARIMINGKRIEKTFATKEQADKWLNSIVKENSDDTLPGEYWKDIPGFSRYQASSLGRIRALKYKMSDRVKVIKPGVKPDGYLMSVFKNDEGKYKSTTIHKMICLAFIGPRPKGLQINHKDGNKANNRPDNLEYLTHSENVLHSFRTGLQMPKRGELNGMAKLTQSDVEYLRERKRTGGRFWGRNELAEEYGISAKHLQRIVNSDKCWK